MNSLSILRTILLLGLLSSAHSEYFDSDKVTIDLYYGPTRSDVVSYPLKEAEKVLQDPHFVHPNTVLYMQDYHEPQLEEYRQYILADAYSKAQICNFLVLDWGTGFVPLEDIKDPNLDELGPLVSDFLIRIHERTDWNQFSIVAYARGTEFTQELVDDLYHKLFYRIPRITQLAPQSYYQKEPQFRDLVTEFVDTIHTDIGKHETDFRKSHVEFFPNGGTDPQPGCSAGTDNLDICSRQRVLDLWAESISNPLAFCSKKADSYDAYKKGDTDPEPEIPMGVACPRWARGKYYLETKAESPFGEGCTQVVADVGDSVSK